MISFESVDRFVKKAEGKAGDAVRGLEKLRRRYNSDNALRWTIRGDFSQFWNRGDEPDSHFADSSHHIDFSVSLFDLALLAGGFIILSAVLSLFRR